MFVGQDNASVGGNDSSAVTEAGQQPKVWNQGYIDAFASTIGVPAGITHYIYMVENESNAFGKPFAPGINEGLNVVSNWAAGDMCMRCYLENTQNLITKPIVHLSISMEFNSEDKIAAGQSDALIKELVDFVAEFSQYPFLIRIGYEFEGSWNGYDPENFKKAFIHIVDALRAKNLQNYAAVMASASMFASIETWESYYPGDDYVDWVGYSFFNPKASDTAPALEFARMHNKPVLIAEASPVDDTMMKTDDAQMLWQEWFKRYLITLKRIRMSSRVYPTSMQNG